MKYVVISDIHIGHHAVPSLDIYHNIKTLFSKNLTILKDIDILFLAGDITDRVIKVFEEDTNVLLKFYDYIMKFCIEHDIKLFILEGTFSHDHHQALVIGALDITKEVDVTYVAAPTIVDHDGLSILFYPDDYTHGTDTMRIAVDALFKEHNVEQVDIAIVHGTFDHQLYAPGAKITYFDAEQFDKRVKYFTHPGHVHLFSEKGKIVAQGSFDRLAHAEEEDKGCLYVDLDKGYTRLINEHAHIFKTINVTDIDDVQDIKHITKYPLGSHIRLYSSKPDNTLVRNIDVVKDTYPDYIFNVKKIKKKESLEAPMMEELENITIDRNNFIETYLTQIPKTPLTDEKIKVLKSIIE